MADRTLLLKMVTDMGNVSKDTKAMTGQLDRFGKTAKSIGVSLGLAFGVDKAVDLMGQAIDKASDLAEQQGKVGAVFGDSAQDVKDWARDLDASFGVTETAALTAAGNIGNLATSMGLTADDAADMSRRMTELAGDLSSFNNVPVEEVLGALQSGLIGEAEPMRKFGVLLSDAAVQAEALGSGLAASKGDITDAIKVQARYNIILGQTSKAQGDASRTSDTWAGKQRLLNVAMDDALVSVGKFLKDGLDPVLAAFVQLTQQAPNTATSIGKATQRMRDDLAAFAQAADDGESVWEQLVFLPGRLSEAAVRAMDPQDAAIHDYVEAHQELLEQFKTTRQGLALFIEAALASGKSWEQVGQMFMDVRIADYLDSWSAAWNAVPAAPAKAAGLTEDATKRIRAAVTSLTFHVKDEGPEWKAAWERMAAWATDPMRTTASQLRRLAKKAAENASKAAADGKPKAARRWRALAHAMRDPVVRSMVQAGAAIDEAVARAWRAKATIKTAADKIRDLFNLGDLFGGPPTAGGGGGSSRSSVGAMAAGAAGFGATSAGRAFLGSSAGMLGAGATYNVNVTGALDPYAVGGQVVRAIKAYERREGKRWRATTS